MNESVTSFLTALDNNDYSSAMLVLDSVLTVNKVDEFSTILEGFIEEEDYLVGFQLKIRDCFADYLGFGPVYFAIMMPSYDIFRIVSSASNRIEAQEVVVDVIIDSVQEGDGRINLSFLEIDALRESPYVLIVPALLSERAKELEVCRIPFSTDSRVSPSKYRYSLDKLLQTHYGRKIVCTFNLDYNYPIIGSDDFQNLHESLQSFGYDVDSMLVEVSEEDWSSLVLERLRHLEQQYMGSKENRLLYRTYLAMISLDSGDVRERVATLSKIEATRTRFCNDALIHVIASESGPLMTRAIQLIEKTNDHSRIDYLCSLLPQASLGVRRTLLRAISTIESAQYFIPTAAPIPRLKTMIDPESRTSETSSKYFDALIKLVRSSSSAARIDAAKALSAIRIPGIESHLRQMMNDEDPKVRLAVLEACVDLPKGQVVDIIRTGIRDEDASVENRALQLFEERWPDSYW